MDSYKKLDPSLSYSFKKYETKRKAGLENLKNYLGITSEIGNPKPARIVLFIECDENADFTEFVKHHIIVNQKRGKLRTAFSPLSSIPYLEEDKRIKKIRSSKYLKLEMDVAQVAVNVPQFITSTHLTGKGVTIGIVDSGIDPNHPAFKGRILRIWDQTLSGPGVLEGGYGIELKDPMLSTSRDRVGHGTHVAGIAAGAYSSPYKGIARGSKLVIVKSDLKDTSIADGIRYIFRIAKEEKSPCVINLSLGGHSDAHDGSDDLSRIIDEQSGTGRIVCCAAGKEEFDEANGYWIAPVFVVDQGEVYNGTFHLSDLDMSALGSSVVSPEMAPYRNAYSNSLQWLGSFVPSPGQSLTAPFWGRIAAIGGSPIAPSGSSEVTVPAGSFDTTLVTWRYGADNRIWIDPNIPYPIKAETFAGVTSGSPPIQYAFELQATGTGQPPPPQAIEVVPNSPLNLLTGRGSYSIQLLWEPDPIIAGQETTLGLIFSDSFGATVTRVTYDLMITSENGTVVTELENQRADNGTDLHTITFPSPGPYDEEVTITSVQGVTTGEFIESATFRVIAS
jgi:subtilisin family serine protease